MADGPPGGVQTTRTGDLPDLRLVGFALGCWLTALGCLYLPALPGALLAAAAGAVAACVGAALAATATPRHRRLVARRADNRRADDRRGDHRAPHRSRPDVDAVARRVGWLAVAILLGVVCGAASTAARVALRDADPLAGQASRHATATVEIVITDDPRPVRGGRGPRTYLVPARLVWIEGPDGRVRVSARVLVLASRPEWARLLPGQRATVTGRLGPSRGGDLRAAVLSVSLPATAVSPPPWAQRAAGGLRAGLREACRPLPPEPGGLLPGLVVGDTSGLDPAVADAFRATGMTHLVAVSGSNCAIVVAAVLLLVRWCRAGPVLSAVLCALALAGFVILARPSPSVLRAAAMGGLALVALASGRPRAAMPALAAAVAVLLVVDPELAAEAGFALSVLATAGLLLLAPRWSAAMRSRGVPAVVSDAVAVPAAAQAACAPVIAAISGTVSATAIPANLLAVPAVAPATVLGVGAALLSPVWMTGAQFLAWLASWPARWLVWLAQTGADAPAGLLPWPGGTAGGLLLAAVLAAVLCAGRISVLRRLALVIAVAAAVGALPVRLVASGWPPAGWLTVACDVGQGDAIVLAAGPGQAVVVDAGPDPAAVDRCLRRLGVEQVVLLVLTHFHADHVGGVEGVLRRRPVVAILTPSLGEPAAGRSSVMTVAARHGVPVDVARPGSSYAAGAVHLAVIGPHRPIVGTRSDPNNNSVVLRATIGRHSVLLAGDAENEEQQGLLNVPLRADVLKLAHHGSSFQDPDFLAAVNPAVALVSVGAGNDYGHPNAAVLARLARAGVRVLRTDVDGDLAVVSRSGQLAVVTRGRDPGTRR
ncbi:MAG TPA: ComEC/Rec2 family competence protein [Micromonosporaceae bacterium]|nr:ComEC/Rec2 family competence protein [Micromonosporaceae bacterium]